MLSCINIMAWLGAIKFVDNGHANTDESSENDDDGVDWQFLMHHECVDTK